jgi:hypothetical protein
MIRKTLHKYTAIELLGCLEELEIVDESGQVMARLTPDPAYREKMYAIARASISEDEIEQARRQRGTGRTLKEILADLTSRNGTVHRGLESGRRTTTRRPVDEGGEPERRDPGVGPD